MTKFIVLLLFVLPSFSHALSVEMKLEDIKIEGTADRESIRRAFQSRIKSFAACGITAGNLQVTLSVDEAGEVKDKITQLQPTSNEATENCFSEALASVNFSFAGIKDNAKILIQFEIGKKEQEEAKEKKRKANEDSQAKVQTKAVETESDKENRIYLNRVKANAIQKMNEQAAKQNQQLQASLACNDGYAKDNLLEKYHRCLDQAKYGGAEVPESKKNCMRSCESQRPNLEMNCQKCTGGKVARQNCIYACQRNITDQINQCTNSCR